MSNDNPRKILDDLARELDGDCIEDSFTWRGRTFKIRLLNEEESNWRNGFVNTSSGLSTVTSFRLPTLAMGIREIDGVPVFDFFLSEWENTQKGRDIVRLVEGRGTFSMKYFAAESMMQFLGSRPPEALEEMWECWKGLEDRREAAQANVKKSSGEDSAKDAKPSTTESSPSGAQ